MPVRSVIAGAVLLLITAASFGAGWSAQGWRLGAQLSAKQAASNAEKAAALLAERQRTAQAIQKANAANAALAEAERALTIAQGERDIARRRLIDEFETDPDLSGSGIPAGRLQSIRDHWGGGGQ
ncbi:hypothetical protein ABEB22_15110 (plasmid) [Thioclava sp. 'Guangxiensis']|uniref:hypothetical protein n=1 Tax=Thioclava sp. 'Guangxiensis' TaxID=3149044 RepID=UPI0032C4B11D